MTTVASEAYHIIQISLSPSLGFDRDPIQEDVGARLVAM